MRKHTAGMTVAGTSHHDHQDSTTEDDTSATAWPTSSSWLTAPSPEVLSTQSRGSAVVVFTRSWTSCRSATSTVGTPITRAAIRVRCAPSMRSAASRPTGNRKASASCPASTTPLMSSTGASADRPSAATSSWTAIAMPAGTTASMRTIAVNAMDTAGPA